MSVRAGIVGLPNVGKSTLFNAITKSAVEAANYPFATINPNVGVVEVKDKRIKLIQDIFNPEKTKYAVVEFVDIAGLVKGASKGEGLGNKFLSNIREVDAICHVVRCFEESDIIHVEERIDPISDAEIINLELIFSDIETAQKRLEKVAPKAKQKDKASLIEATILEKIIISLEKNIPIRDLELSEEENFIVKGFNFLTQKKMIYVMNISDSSIGNESNDKIIQDFISFAKKENTEYVMVSSKIEHEISLLSDEEQSEFLSEIGLDISGLDNLIINTYNLLGLNTFFTAGKVEVRAWTFKKGYTAPECAGVIHTDFQKGFIKAEVYHFEDLEKYKTEQLVKENGRMRLEGKDYLMKDGDICFFKFNV